jgi:hypothetical protein
MDCAASSSPRRPSFELADIVRAHGEACRRSFVLTPDQSVVLRDIVRCRTAALGGHLDVCDRCAQTAPLQLVSESGIAPSAKGSRRRNGSPSARNASCPSDTFTSFLRSPQSCTASCAFAARRSSTCLFACASQTLLELARDERHLGAELGMTAVLHTWTRELLFHPHVHCIVTGGGLALDGRRWIDSGKKFLFHVNVMSAVFRGKFLDRLRKAYALGAFTGFHGFDDPEGFDRLMIAIARKNWIVYAKRAFGGAEQVYRYLGRYTHRVGIANSRLVALRDDVTFRTKNGKTITVAPTEFLRRFLLHVLPPRFIKMRHFGLLASGNVNTKLASARALLNARRTRSATCTAPSGQEILDALMAEKPRPCPLCHVGSLHRRPLPPNWSATTPILDSS